MLERVRRANAGNRMNKLLEEQAEEEEEKKDDFYNNTYGGFNEEEEDVDYESEVEQEDIIDSDFSLSEHEDEANNGGDGDGDDDEKKKRKMMKKKAIKKITDKPSEKTKKKKQYVKKILEPVKPLDKETRMRATTLLKGADLVKRNSTQAMKRHPKMPQMRRLTQDELLAEAKITEQHNTASLAQFLKLEEEKKNVKVLKPKFQGPTIRFQSVRMPEIEIAEDGNESKEEFFCRNFIEFTDTKSFPRQYFPYPCKVKYPEKSICVVTGRPAKYKDPVSGLPYTTIEAFKYIRQHRKRLKEKLNKVKSDEMKRRRKMSIV